MDLHRGDAWDFLAAQPDAAFDLTLTDPPFGITNLAWDKAPDAARLLDELHRVTARDGAVLIFAAGKFTQAVMNAAGKRFRYKLVWRKIGSATGGLDARRRPMRIHEDILVLGETMPRYFPVMTTGHAPYKASARGECVGGHWRAAGAIPARVNTGERYPIDVLEFPRPSGKGRFHPTQKPVALLDRLVRLYSPEGGRVCDPFFGSGSTAAACIDTGRSFAGAELDPTYFAAARRALEPRAQAAGVPLRAHAGAGASR
ncbi:MAG: site-specific DNA-methyltransferase [Phycisphaerales bacterium]|nr:site-specific DNA-methyltransferase [Phycisphaerales bacterium]